MPPAFIAIGLIGLLVIVMSAKANNPASGSGAPTGPVFSGSRLSPAQIMTVAVNAGFPVDTAITMVAIAMKESSGYPTAHNTKPPDDSYGLWQINMLKTLGERRLVQFGLNSKDELFDPDTNARAAFMIWGGNDSNLGIAWAIDREPNKTRYESYLPVANQAAIDGGYA